MGSIAEKASGSEVLERLRKSLSPRWDEYVALVSYRVDKDPFAVLVSIVLSQNTNDKNSIKAYLKLRENVGVSVNDIMEASENSIIESIKIAGLARQKAKTLKELAKAVHSWGGPDYLLREDPSILRKKLIGIPGVGPKTADVFLSLVRKARGVFAVDTHAARIAKRWGLVGEKAGYDEVSQSLIRFFGDENNEEAHRLLIALGRKYCAARRPRCVECPLKDICPSARQQ
ncbi:MAG: endonuclease III [Aeropyrum sp.]|nr:endonuclease III [Aeropyrum sp.]